MSDRELRSIRWFPKRWRARYGKEFEALLEELRDDRQFSGLAAFDVARLGLSLHKDERESRRRLLVVGTCVTLAVGGLAIVLTVGGGIPPRALPAAASQPDCLKTAIANTGTLPGASTAFVTTGGYPFDVQVTPDGNWSFVSLPEASGSEPSSVAVYADKPLPEFVGSIALPSPGLGEAVTKDGKYLLVAANTGADVIDLAAAESGAPQALVGALTGFSPPSGVPTRAWLVAITPNERYAFVSFPNVGRVAVFDLARALALGFNSSDFIGVEPVGSPQGLAVSPNGHWLYVSTSSNLDVINLAKAPALPSDAAEAANNTPFPITAFDSSTTPGCFYNRVITSANGRIVWVTDSYRNELLGFSATKLVRDPAEALLTTIKVGALPVGLALVNNGRFIAVADSNWGAWDRSAPRPQPGYASNLIVVNTSAALSGRPAVVGTVTSGLWPRGVAWEANDKTLLVANSISGQLEAVHLDALGR